MIVPGHITVLFPPSMTMLVEYKPFEPAFYHTDLADWGTSFTVCQKLGERAKVGTPREAAAFGEVILLAVPYGATPQVGRDYASELAGKVVLDAGNPRPGRDGPMAEEAVEMGAGLASQQFLPGVRLVRAFNAISAHNLRSQAHRSGEKLAIPLAADDEAALQVAARLVTDAGFDPVIVGPLAAGAAKHGPYDAIIVEGGIEVLPPVILDQLKEGGRIVALFTSGALGTVRMGRKEDGHVAWRDLFNAAAPALRGFTTERVFAL